jgi:SAM-dependent methyltransferase
MTELERFWIEKSVIMVATQERFAIFQKILQENIKDNSAVCSLPCGLMDDLLTLDLKQCPNIKLIAIDNDEESIALAKESAIEKGLIENCQFRCIDAWKSEIENEFDILTSNGINVYAKSDEMLVKLYEVFYRALKAGGLLITSMVNLPNEKDMASLDDEFKQDFMRTYAISFVMVNQQTSDYYHPPLEKSLQLLKSVGFKDVQIINEKRNFIEPLQLENKRKLNERNKNMYCNFTFYVYSII